MSRGSQTSRRLLGRSGWAVHSGVSAGLLLDGGLDVLFDRPDPDVDQPDVCDVAIADHGNEDPADDRQCAATSDDEFVDDRIEYDCSDWDGEP